MTGAVVVLAREVLKQAAWAENIRNVSTATGQAAKDVQILEYAAQQAGLSFSSITSGAEKLEAQLGENAEAFSRLGLDVEKLKQMAPADMFKEVLERVSALGTQHERNAAAVALFGKAGAAAYLPLIESLKDLEQQARETNVVLSEQELDALTRLDGAVDKLSGSWEGLKRHFSAFVADSSSSARWSSTRNWPPCGGCTSGPAV